MHNIPTEHYDVAIIGGGMVGMSLGIALARAGMQIFVAEQTSLPTQLEPSFDGRVSAIALGSQRILDNIGVWRHMADHAEPIRDIRVSDSHMPFFLHYDHQEVGTDPFGFIVENRYIRHALHQASEGLSGLTVKDQLILQSYDSDADKVTVRFSNDTISCKLLIGADGKHSQLRHLAGIEATGWSYEQTAIVCTIAHEFPHHGLAQERFLIPGPFAVLPMTANRSSLVWVEPDERIKLYLELPEEEFVQEIKERVGDYLGKITLAGKRFSYPLSLMHAKAYIGDRLALIGDAAHAVHPIAGQGVNLGFRDVGVLADILTQHYSQKKDIGAQEVLVHYQRWRRFDNVTMLIVTDNLNRLFSTDFIPIKLARNLGLWGVSKIPPLKRLFMKHAMGLAGDIPSFSRLQN